MGLRLILLVSLLALPLTGFAAVRIHEIAWMGSADSSADEWVELFNDQAAPVALDGWTLSALDGSPSIPLSGSIPPGGYFLIERTDDGSVPSVAADLIASFGNGLSNAGETLRLTDASGALVDEIVGGENWSNVGGDNATKATAQRSGNGWITAASTPRAANAAQSVPDGTEQDDPSPKATMATSSGSGASQGASGAVFISLSPYPRENISAFAPEDRKAYAGATTTFLGGAKGLYDEEIPHATYHWNFGDGAVGSGNPASHVYLHPGNYVAVLEVVWGEKRATDRLRVSVAKTDVIIANVSTSTGGAVVLKNVSASEVDLSDWTLSLDGRTVFRFPTHSVILPGESLHLSFSVLGSNPEAEIASLFYPTGIVAHEWSSPRPLPPRQKMPSLEPMAPRVAPRSDGIVLGATVVKPEPRVAFAAGPSSESRQSREFEILDPWTLILLVLILFGVVATLYVRTFQASSEAEQYEIIVDAEDADGK